MHFAEQEECVKMLLRLAAMNADDELVKSILKNVIRDWEAYIREKHL